MLNLVPATLSKGPHRLAGIMPGNCVLRGAQGAFLLHYDILSWSFIRVDGGVGVGDGVLAR